MAAVVGAEPARDAGEAAIHSQVRFEGARTLALIPKAVAADMRKSKTGIGVPKTPIHEREPAPQQSLTVLNRSTGPLSMSTTGDLAAPAVRTQRWTTSSPAIGCRYPFVRYEPPNEAFGLRQSARPEPPLSCYTSQGRPGSLSHNCPLQFQFHDASTHHRGASSSLRKHSFVPVSLLRRSSPDSHWPRHRSRLTLCHCHR